MKFKKYLFLFMASIIAFSCFGTLTVHAEKYTGQAIWPSEYISNIYIKKARADGYTKYQQARFIRRSEDNKFVYCIQPYTDIDNNNVYNIARSDWWTVANLTKEQWREASLLAYYGYGYGNHTDHKWYAITQVMIWRVVEPTSDIYFTDTLNGNRISQFESEMAELQSLVNNHSVKPNISIPNDTVTIGNEIVVTDSNGVLDNFSVASSNNLQVSKNGNNLVIKGLNVGEGTITFSKSTDKYDSYPVLYYVDGSQNVFRVGNYDPIKITLNVRIIGGKLTLHKVDRDSGDSVPSGEGELSNAVYGIYDMADNLITKVTTDSNGYVVSEVLPYFSQYKLKELSSSKGYELDGKTYTFEITAENLYPEITVYEQIIKRPIQIHKYIANGETGNLVPEKNVLFEFYNNKNEKVVSVNTDSDGLATLNLPYGTYTGKQITVEDGLEKINDFTVTINEQSPEIINLSFSNAPITAKLKLIKIDSESGKTIPFAGVKFKIKNDDTGEYVCQNITYPERQEICEYETTSEGEFITPYPLISSNYSIEELTSPTGYLLSDDSIQLRIDGDSVFIDDSIYGKYVQVEFANDKIKGEIKIIKKGEHFLVEDGSYTFNEVDLEGIEFSLYADEDITTLDGVNHYKKGDLVGKVTTSSKGEATFEDLYLGKYIVKETSTLDNFILDETEHSIELKEVDNKTAIVKHDIKLKNYLKKGTLEFTKTDLVNGEVIPNVLINIYTKDNQLIYSGKTDSEGKITITDLPVNRYYITERESVTGYLLSDEKVYFEIKENNEIVKAEMTNKPITGTLEFTKVDFSTNEPIPNTLIEIYSVDDEENPIFSGKTDENGMIIIEELRYGKYFILEKETASSDYILNTERMYFDILEDGEIVKATMVNEKVPVEVPSTGATDYNIAEVIGSFLILAGLGMGLYVIKKKKNK